MSKSAFEQAIGDIIDSSLESMAKNLVDPNYKPAPRLPEIKSNRFVPKIKRYLVQERIPAMMIAGPLTPEDIVIVEFDTLEEFYKIPFIEQRTQQEGFRRFTASGPDFAGSTCAHLMMEWDDDSYFVIGFLSLNCADLFPKWESRK